MRIDWTPCFWVKSEKSTKQTNEQNAGSSLNNGKSSRNYLLISRLTLYSTCFHALPSAYKENGYVLGNINFIYILRLAIAVGLIMIEHSPLKRLAL